MTTVEPIRNLAEVRKIESVLRKQSMRNIVLFTLGTNCGLRISDILNLDVGDVKDKSFIQIVEQKTGKSKKFPINSKLKPMLAEYTKGKKENEPLFTTIFKNRMERTAAYRIINTACKIAKIEAKTGTHTMRKTFGYHHYKKFKDIAMLQKIFNHCSPEVTLRYIGIEQEQIEKSYTQFVL